LSSKTFTAKTKFFLIALFFCFILISCAPSQVSFTTTPFSKVEVIQTSTSTSTVTSTPKPQNTATPTEAELPIEIPVLVIAYYPTDPNHPKMLDRQETNIDKSIESMQQYVAQLVEQGAQIASEATRYHGYKDPSAPMYLQYKVIDKLEFFKPFPRGVPLGNSSYRPFYAQIFQEQNICDYVDRLGVREIWIYGYHSNWIVPDESKMSSIYGDISNALPHDEEVAEQFKLPLCENSYVMYNFNYDREIQTTIHNRMHQIENVISYAENYEYPASPDNKSGSLFWDDFSFWGYLGSKPGYRASCGNAHSAPNSVVDYTYTSTEIKENNCETWNPDDSKTTYVLSDCSQWHCTEMGFYTWYMQNIPGYNNGIQYQGKDMRNWWDAMADFNKFIGEGRSLYFDSGSSATSIVGSTPTPTSPDDRPVFDYPVDQQILDFGGDYLFKVQPYPDATGYLWGFFQDGVLVWENLRDDGEISGENYQFLFGSAGYKKIKPGEVEVWVRALVNNKFTEPAVIKIIIRNP